MTTRELIKEILNVADDLDRRIEVRVVTRDAEENFLFAQHAPITGVTAYGDIRIFLDQLGDKRV